MSDEKNRNEQNGEAAQERGERIETGKDIARGGTNSGAVPGAEPTQDSADPQTTQKASAVSEAMSSLGDNADASALAEHVSTTKGVKVTAEEVARIRTELLQGRV